MATKTSGKYDSDSIISLHGLDGVRANASMYMGSVDATGRFLSVRELLDNALDEFLAGRNKSVDLFINKDGSYHVHDMGDGVPQGTKVVEVVINGKTVKNSIPTMQAIFGDLHTSGKYRSDAYKTSVGTHGIGAKGTNATSTFFKVWTIFKGACYHVAFEKGKLKSAVAKVKPPKAPDGTLLKKGTLIHFQPDPTIYTAKTFPPSMLGEWSEMMAYLNPGFRITAHAGGKSKSWFSKLGPIEYVQKRWTHLKCTPMEGADKKLFESHTELADVVVSFTTAEGADVRGFTNGLNNPDGGKHVDSVLRALYKGITPHKKKRGPDFNQLDFRDGLVGLVNAKLHKAQFAGQNKAKLTDDRVGLDFEESLTETAIKFFNANKTLAAALVEKASKFAALKSKFKASANVIRDLNRIKRVGMPAKFAAAHPSTKVADRELYLIEGDSAAGTVKEARFPFQACLPLKGKIKNALNDPKGRAPESEEITNIFGAIGYEPKAADPYSKLQVGKLIVLADPDPDGPFVGDTIVNVRIAGELKTLTMAELARCQEPFTVRAVHPGGAIVEAEATCNLVKTADELVTIELDKIKYRTDIDHKWAVVNYKPWHVSEGTITVDAHGIGYKRAKDLRAGDRILNPLSKQIDKASGKPYSLVAKHKRHFINGTPLFCMTVPKCGNFMLPHGPVSSNCHIEVLNLSLFYRYLPELFDRGMIYIAETPEFYSISKGRLVTGDTVSQVKTRLKKIGAPNAEISHIKGWGEIDPNLMRVLAMDPATRRLVRINMSTGQDEQDFNLLMGADATYRKQMLGIELGASSGDD